MSYSKMPALIKAFGLFHGDGKKNRIVSGDILVGAQLGENIGTVARYAQFGLTDLRLVSPRPGWQMERAKASAGAEALIENHLLFETFGRRRPI